MGDAQNKHAAVVPPKKNTLSADEMLDILKNERSERLIAALREYLADDDGSNQKKFH